MKRKLTYLITICSFILLLALPSVFTSADNSITGERYIFYSHGSGTDMRSFSHGAGTD
ncbi:hypothetical protein ACXFAU_18015 [Paenibacillus glucanolyticus]|uniref:hypothetical protein n=1 Tax=Paenibacillus glucanolyticus TaxID=59843 RepID=UPI0036BC171D